MAAPHFAKHTDRFVMKASAAT